MSSGQGSKVVTEKKRGISRWWIVYSALITVFICSVISWALISTLAANKSEHASDITQINNTLGHIKDMTTGLNNYANYQDNSTQTRFDDVDSEILGINNELDDNLDQHDQINNDIADVKNNLTSAVAAVKTKTDNLDTTLTSLNTAVNDSSSGLKAKVDNLNTTVNDASSGLKAKVDNLNTTVNGSGSGLKTKVDNLTSTVNEISGLQIIPTITTASGGGTISLAIISTQTVTSRIIAFRVEFRPNSNVVQSATMDASLAALYGTPPVTLRPGGSSSTAVGADHTTYDLYWSSGAYHLESITFNTEGTSIAKGDQTKTLAYTYTGSISYDVAITPEYESSTTSTGASISTW
jgi:predicted  nucleic acid-binding Zn-ribbon protein